MVFILKKLKVLVGESQGCIQDLDKHLKWRTLWQLQSSPAFVVGGLLLHLWLSTNPPGTYLLKVNNKNTRTRYEICSKLTIKTPERRHWRSVSIVNFEHLIAVRNLIRTILRKNRRCQKHFFPGDYNVTIFSLSVLRKIILKDS